jgi:hypothetical protein
VDASTKRPASGSTLCEEAPTQDDHNPRNPHGRTTTETVVGDAGAGARAGPHAGDDSGGDPLHRPRCRGGTAPVVLALYTRCTRVLVFESFLRKCYLYTRTYSTVRTREYVNVYYVHGNIVQVSGNIVTPF